jgi:hypothetical protein
MSCNHFDEKECRQRLAQRSLHGENQLVTATSC